MGILKSIFRNKIIEYLTIPVLILLSIPAAVNFWGYRNTIIDNAEEHFLVKSNTEHNAIAQIFQNNPDNYSDKIIVNNILHKSTDMISIIVFEEKKLIYANNRTNIKPIYDSLVSLTHRGFNAQNEYYSLKSEYRKNDKNYTIFTLHYLSALQEQISKKLNRMYQNTLILLIIYLILLFMVIYYFIKPVRDLSRQIAIIADGKIDAKIKNIKGVVEFQTIADNINKIIDSQSKSNKVIIGELKESVKNLEIQNRELSFAKNKAEEANQLKSEFLSNVSHEIRTPLNAIIGFTDFLLTKSEDNTFVNYLTIIKNSSKTLLTLINDILDISKIEAGKLEIKQSPTNLIKMLEEVVEIFEPKAREKGLIFHKTIPTTFPQVISIDEIRLRQVLMNLLGNAIKFTEKGYVSISLILGRYDRASESLDFEISVKDSGIGIPAEEQKRIFEPFVQQEGQSYRKFGGTGLGLAISKKLIEKMQGRIDLVSEVGVGSDFIISFKNVDFEETSKISNEPFSPVNYQYPEANILIVDDMDVNRQVVIELFSDTPLKFYEAADGVQAINIAKSEKIDLILMDIRMPVMDGNEATNILKTTEETKHIPVVALTASANQMIQSSIINSVYFDEIILKPAETALLKSVIYKYLTTDKSKPKIENKTTDKDLNNNPLATIEDNLKIEISKKFKETASKLKSKLYMGEVKTLSEDFRIYAESTNNEVIIEFAKEFENSIKSFQLNKIKTYLDNLINL